ncbi:hypothetical protein D3C85_1839410 [compost metagenome]
MHVHIAACEHGSLASLFFAARYAVRNKLMQRVVVACDDAFKAPFIAQNRLQQVRVRASRDTVNFVEGCHNAKSA